MQKWQSPKIWPKRVKILISEWNQKQVHFFPHPSRSLSCTRFVVLCSWSEDKLSQRRVPSGANFAPPWIHPLTELTKKQQHLWGTMSTSFLLSFVKIHQAVLEERLNMCSITYTCISAPPSLLNHIKSVKNSWKFQRQSKLKYKH